MVALLLWAMFNCNPPIAHCHPLLWGGGILVDHWSTISSLPSSIHRTPSISKLALLCSIHNKRIPDSKVHGANMGPIWGRQDPGGPHVGPMNFVIWDDSILLCDGFRHWFLVQTTEPSNICFKCLLNGWHHKYNYKKINIHKYKVKYNILSPVGTKDMTWTNDDYFQLHPWKQTLVKSWSKCSNFLGRKSISKCCWQYSSHFVLSIKCKSLIV